MLFIEIIDVHVDSEVSERTVIRVADCIYHWDVNWSSVSIVNNQLIVCVLISRGLLSSCFRSSPNLVRSIEIPNIAAAADMMSAFS